MISSRFSTLAAPILAVCCALRMMGQTPVAAGYIDSINPNGVPEDFVSYGSLNNIGWYYTPTQSYSLTGISTDFGLDEFGGGLRTITVQIQTDRPVNGGTVLDQGTFQGSGLTDGILGASFATPVQLTAGVTYFVDFLNLQGMGLNIGQWASVNGVDVPTNGATTRLGAYYFGSNTDVSFTNSISGDAADQSNGYGTASGLEPILFFSGTPSVVPEPSSFLMLGIGVVGAAWKFRRRGR
jgi:hypothetical protein